MSDTYYRERAARRTQRLVLSGIIIGALICLVFGVTSIFYDNCTAGFNRQPTAVVNSFVSALSQGNLPTVVRCWEHNAYMDVEAGCSEICLSRIVGTPFQVLEIKPGETMIENNRARILVEVRVACAVGDTQHTGEITLDSVVQDLPWRHWKIVHSSFGGPLSAPWCQE